MSNTTKPSSRPQSNELSARAGVRTGSTVADLKQSFADGLLCRLGRVPRAATRHDLNTALARDLCRLTELAERLAAV